MQRGPIVFSEVGVEAILVVCSLTSLVPGAVVSLEGGGR